MIKIPFLQQSFPTVKNIIFDLGGVILNVDYGKTIEAFRNLGIENFDTLFSQAQQTDLFDRLDMGIISNADFRNELRNFKPSLKLTDDQIDMAWNAMLLDMPLERLQVLETLQPHFRTFLLSNTNAIHVPLFSSIVKQSIGKNDLSDFFEKTYYSNEMGMRKPNTDIYEFVLKQHNLNGNETLFIDDTLQNVEGAQKAGLHAFHLTAEHSIVKLFEPV